LNFKNCKEPGISYNVFNAINLLIICNNHLYKCFHFINFESLAYIIRDSLGMMYKYRNIVQCYKKHLLLIYIVHLLDKYSKILLHNAWHTNQACCNSRFNFPKTIQGARIFLESEVSEAAQ
jgi:hypothetical protein